MTTTTTRHITTWTASGATSGRPALDVLTSVAGDYAADYDLDTAEREYLDEIQARLPEGVTVHANGDVYGPADHVADVDIAGIADSIDVSPILEGHQWTATYKLEGAVMIGDEVIGHYDADGGEWIEQVDAMLRGRRDAYANDGWVRIGDWTDQGGDSSDSIAAIRPATN